MGGDSVLTVRMPTGRFSDVQEAAAKLTRAEGKNVKPPDIGRNALAFYCAAIAKCPACCTGTKCSIHGTAAVRPGAEPEPDDGPSAADCRRVTDAYFAAFTSARGARPPFGAREGKAVKDIVSAVGVDSACAVVAAAFADDFWKGKATILIIASDPSRHIGDAPKSKGKTASSLQPDSGYKGGDER
jgi:hypothetical protein